MNKHNRTQAERLNRYRSALVQACGLASMLDRQEDAKTLGEMIGRAMLDNMQQDKQKTRGSPRGK